MVSFVFAVLAFFFQISLNSETTTDKGNDNSDGLSSISNQTTTSLVSQATTTEVTKISTTHNTDDSSNIPSNTPEENPAVKITGTSFSGYISTKNQEDLYEYTPTISGIYRFDFNTNDVNANYKFYVYSNIGECIVSSSSSVAGKTVKLTADKKYSIIVEQYSGFPQYTITIGVPNDLKTIDDVIIKGTASYSDQEDKYLYTAPITGQYRFDFTRSDVQCDCRFYIYSSNNTQLVSTYFSNNGKTINLTEGETYTIIVQQYSGFLDYTLTIGVPNAIQSINNNSFSGNITYKDQLDRYTYIAPVSGIYRFSFVSDNNQSDYRFFMYSPYNEQLASTYYSNSGKTVNLLAGETYRIEVEQYSGIENYTINIGVPNNVSSVDGNSILGSISYKDQENIYTYIAPVSGKYTFILNSDDVTSDYKFNLILPINEQLLSTYYSNNNKTVQLVEGQVYTIKVIQHSGYPSYQIDINIEYLY